MMTNELIGTSFTQAFKDRHAAPRSAGRPRRFVSSGFTAVDVMLDGAVKASPGGTATNVARALQTMGWATEVIGTIGHDPAGKFLRNELREDGVGVDNLRLDPQWTTPIVLQEAKRGDHVWRFQCPFCRTPFAKHRPTPSGLARQLIDALPAPDVFFFDRLSLFALSIADAWAQQGTFVVFEPAGLGRPHLFERASHVANLIKFSSERAPAFREHLRSSPSSLVETLGADGARLLEADSHDWQYVAANQIENIVDSAGAGDWTTAGLLDELFSTAVGARAEALDLAKALAHGQVLGAEACAWKGVYPREYVEFDRADFESFACPRVVHESRSSTRELTPA